MCPDSTILPSQVLREQFYDAQGAVPFGEDSSHWREMKLHFRMSEKTGETPDRILGFGFGESDVRPSWTRKLFHELEIAAKSILIGSRGLSKSVYRARQVVRQMGLHFSRDAYRQACTRNFLERQLSNPPQRIVMIGDGPGILSALLHDLWPLANLVLIDLGATLAVSAQNLEKAFPNQSHSLGGETLARFTYVPAESLQNFPAGEIDLAINIASMQEMKAESVLRYFSLLRESKTKLFYCNNRLEKIMPGGETSRIMDYPWMRDDRHVVDELCPWHQWFLAYSGGKSALHVGCIAIPLVKIYDGPHWHRLTKMVHTK